MSAQGKPETTWPSQLTIGTGVHSMSLLSLENKWGENGLSPLDCESMMTGKQKMDQKVLLLEEKK